MKKSVICGLLLICLLMLSTAPVVFKNVSAQTFSTITITSDGSVEGTDLIHREGNVYTLTDDISGIITVEKNGVIIDGAGYAVKGNQTVGVDLRKDSNASLPGYGGIVVKNVRFCDKSQILAASGGNSFLNNIFEGGGIEIIGGSSDERNVIKCNVFIDGRPAIFTDSCSASFITENDFVNCSIYGGPHGGMPQFYGNYWSDYETLYPAARKLLTGIWDTPYSYHADVGRQFTDYSPLVNPTNGAGAPPAVTEKPFPTYTNPYPPILDPFPPIITDPIPTASVTEDEPESFPIILIIVASIASVVIVSTSLLVYFKNRK